MLVRLLHIANSLHETLNIKLKTVTFSQDMPALHSVPTLPGGALEDKKHNEHHKHKHKHKHHHHEERKEREGGEKEREGGEVNDAARPGQQSKASGEWQRPLIRKNSLIMPQNHSTPTPGKPKRAKQSFVSLFKSLRQSVNGAAIGKQNQRKSLRNSFFGKPKSRNSVVKSLGRIGDGEWRASDDDKIAEQVAQRARIMRTLCSAGMCFVLTALILFVIDAISPIKYYADQDFAGDLTANSTNETLRNETLSLVNITMNSTIHVS